MRVTEQFVFFWIPKDFLSQWFAASFEDKSLRFRTAEHYMMFQKAVLFELPDMSIQDILVFLAEDREAYRTKQKDNLHITNQILDASTPKEAKALGRKVKNFNEAQWNAKAQAVLYRGNKLKFTQNPELLEQFLSFDERTFVEASPYDKIYGIGLKSDHPDALNLDRWRGKNILGFVLTKLAKDLKQELSQVT